MSEVPPATGAKPRSPDILVVVMDCVRASDFLRVDPSGDALRRATAPK